MNARIDRIFGERGWTLSAAFVLAAMVSSPASAQTLTTPVTFDCNAGDAGPPAGLIADANGNLFGTTRNGGANGYGTVFEIVKSAGGYASSPTILFNFDGGANGAEPFGGLMADASGNLFGTTYYGGASNAPYGYGTVFEITGQRLCPAGPTLQLQRLPAARQ